MFGLEGVALDDVSHGVLGAGAVHDLLRHVVRVSDESPRDIAEVATLGQFLDGFTQLAKENDVRLKWLPWSVKSFIFISSSVA